MPKTYVSPLSIVGASALALRSARGAALGALLLSGCADGLCDGGACNDPASEASTSDGGSSGAGATGANGGEGGEGTGMTGNGGNGAGASGPSTAPTPNGNGGEGSPASSSGGNGGTLSGAGGADAGVVGSTDGGLDGGAPSGGADGGFTVPIEVTRCTDGTECTATQPVCDTGLDRCVVCLLEDDSGCPADTPYCVGTGNDVSHCIECESVSDCDLEAPICSPDGACVACMGETDCAEFGDRPLCRDDGQCVGCVSEADCPLGMPVCDATGQCAPCSDSAECAHLGATPVCDATTGGCVECTTNTDCSEPTAPHCGSSNTCEGCTGPADCMGFDGIPVCDGTTGECVECVANTDCGTTTASACVNNACTPCTDDSGCSHLPGTTVCDAGLCVQCTGVKDDACAVGTDEYVCDSLNRTCAAAVPENEVGEAGTCDSCFSDAHCNTGRVCVQTEYDGQVVPGWYCQWEQGATGGPANCANDAQPYFSLRLGVVSIDGSDDLSVCGLRVSTCAAQRDFSAKVCDPAGDEASQCGEPNLDDGLCREVENQGVYRCTARCVSSDDCDGVACETGESPRYCTL